MWNQKNKKTKGIILILIAIFFTGCNLSDGNLGGGQVYEFNCSSKKLNKCLESIEKNDAVFKIPNKWKQYNDWEKTGYGFLKGKVFYMKKNNVNFKEEMYYISLFNQELPREKADSIFNSPMDNTIINDTTISQIGIRSVFRMVKNKPWWFKYEEISHDEIEIIEKRFQKSILDKVAKSGCGCTQYKKIDENKAGILIQ